MRRVLFRHEKVLNLSEKRLKLSFMWDLFQVEYILGLISVLSASEPKFLHVTEIEFEMKTSVDCYSHLSQSLSRYTRL